MASVDSTGRDTQFLEDSEILNAALAVHAHLFVFVPVLFSLIEQICSRVCSVSIQRQGEYGIHQKESAISGGRRETEGRNDQAALALYAWLFVWFSSLLLKEFV